MEQGKMTAMPPAETSQGVEAIIKACHAAWRQGFMAGFSGNASVRLPTGAILITAAGTAKGMLGPCDCLLLDNGAAIAMPGRKPSSESALHVAVYAACPACGAILHTHPPELQAVEIALGRKSPEGKFEAEFLNLPLFESEMWRRRLFFASPLPPGSGELAQSAAQALPAQPTLPCAVWLGGHGLCALAASLENALCLTEELEHLAKVQLLARVW